MSSESPLPFVSRGSHQLGGRARDGFVVLGEEFAGFVPTADWRSVVGEVALGLVVTTVELSKPELELDPDSPNLAVELEALTAARGGFMLGSDWSWGRMSILGAHRVLIRRGKEVVSCVEPPARALARWPQVVPSKRAPLVASAVVGGLALVCAAAGTIGWKLTGNSDLLIAGLSFAGLLLVALAGALYSLKRSRS